jgi:hypothetical protein
MNSPLRLRGTLLSLWLVLLVGLRAELVLDDAGRFAVDIAAPYARSENETNSGLGPTTLHLLSHDGGKIAFILGYNDYPPGSVAKLDLAETYRNVMKGVLDSMKCEARTSGDHRLGDINGWEYTLVAKDNSLAGHVRSYFVGDRLYQVMYLGPVDSENSGESLHFLDSFRLLH